MPNSKCMAVPLHVSLIWFIFIVSTLFLSVLSMEMSKEEIAAKFDIVKKLKLLKAMQEPVQVKKSSLSQPSQVDISWLSKFLGNIDESGENAARVGEEIGTMDDNTGLEHGSHLGALVVIALDFLRIPITYIVAYALKKKVPISVNNNVRWLYSAILLALTITALALPATAPIMAFISAGIGLAVGAFILGNILYTRYQLGKERRQIKGLIKLEEGELLSIQDEANHLENQLRQATEEEHISAIYVEMVSLQERYEFSKKRLLELKNKELQLDQKIEHLGTKRVVDKCIAICLSALTIMGLVISLFFPPVGLAILAGVAIAGATYLFIRITTPLFRALANLFMSKKTSESIEINKGLANEPVLRDSEEQEKDSSLAPSSLAHHENMTKHSTAGHTHESTSDVMVRLMGSDEDAVQVLQHELAETQEPEALNAKYQLLIKPPAKKTDAQTLQDDDGDGDIETESERPQNQ